MPEQPQYFDCMVRYHWAGQAEIMTYLPVAWQEFVGVPNSLPGGAGAIPVLPDKAYHHPLIPHGPERSYPALHRFEELAEYMTRQPGLRGLVLTAVEAAAVAALPHVQLAEAMCTAVNDWTRERWLQPADGRVSAAVVVPAQEPERAAAEIRRVARLDARFVEVLLGPAALNRPFGHPVYDPIFRAAADTGLTVSITAGSDAIAETLVAPSAGGLPATYAEYAALSSQSLATHLVSVIAQGVLERYPDLRILLKGGGVSWLPSVLWRMDQSYRSYRREVSWLRRYPSDYVARGIRVSSGPIEQTADPLRYARYLASYPALGTITCFSSGAPEPGHDTPERVRTFLPAGWGDAVLRDNAMTTYARMSASAAQAG